MKNREREKQKNKRVRLDFITEDTAHHYTTLYMHIKYGHVYGDMTTHNKDYYYYY